MEKITYFHRNKSAGFSIDKVTQTVISHIKNKSEYYMPCLGANPSKIMKNILYTYKRRDSNGINHITGDVHYCILGLIGCISVLTVHDLVFLNFQKLNIVKRFVLKWLYVRLPLFYATKVVAISTSTKRELEKYTNRKDIVVIHNAVDPSFDTILKDQNITPYKVLFIGTKPNKNLERTVLALKGIDCQLTIIGKLSEQQLEILRASKVNYINKNNLTDDEIRREYVNTDLVSFVSLYEGFGMPIIEGNKVGRPVIASNLPVLKEVGGDSCVYVNPKNVDDMHKGFVRLFDDSTLRQKCVDLGLENVKQYESQRIFKQWESLYRELYKN